MTIVINKKIVGYSVTGPNQRGDNPSKAAGNAEKATDSSETASPSQPEVATEAHQDADPKPDTAAEPAAEPPHERPVEQSAHPAATESVPARRTNVTTLPVRAIHDGVERPECLVGATYKITSPLSEHAIYVTINDMVLNEGDRDEERRPFEIFCNSKNMDQFQWIVGLTRVISAVFRKGGDVAFLADELKAVFDPRGGYYKPGGIFMPSLVAEIGTVLETHMKRIGLIGAPELSAAQQQLIAEKRAEIARRSAAQAAPAPRVAVQAEPQYEHIEEPSQKFPPNARVCGKCNVKALMKLDNCDTCLNCGYSKCG